MSSRRSRNKMNGMPKQTDKLNLPYNDFNYTGSGVKGAATFNLSCSEIEGRRTVHIDGFSAVRPYGHIWSGDVSRLIEWLKRADGWIKENPVELRGDQDERRTEII